MPDDKGYAPMRDAMGRVDGALRTIDASIELYCLHRDQGSALIVRYEEIVADAAHAVAEPRRLALEQPPEHDAVAAKQRIGDVFDDLVLGLQRHEDGVPATGEDANAGLLREAVAGVTSGEGR